jgi:hypothetical protein
MGWVIFAAGVVVGIVAGVLALFRWLLKEWQLW